jgi:EpsI family protein
MTEKTKSSWRFALLLAVLLLGSVVINLWERAGEARVERRTLKDFPAQLGQWRQTGADERLGREAEEILRADDYLVRNYIRSDGRAANFYVGYYATQRTGATFHSPLNCLPGSGWSMSEPGLIRIVPGGGAPSFEANRYIVQNGDNRQLLIYWYQGRGRAVTSEYWGKIYTVFDSVRRRRSDGAMVRVMVPVGASEKAALEVAADMAAQVAPELPRFVPD